MAASAEAPELGRPAPRMSDLEDARSSPLFTAQSVVALGAGMMVVLEVGNRLVAFVRASRPTCDCARYWPISIYGPRLFDWPFGINANARLEPAHWAALGLSIALFALVLAFRARIERRFVLALAAGASLLVATTLIQGWTGGFADPVAAGNIQYYHDASKVTGAADFLAHFTTLQPSLANHGRTHPPGAILLLYALRRVIGSERPDLIGLFIALTATAVSGALVYRLVAKELGREAGPPLVLLFLLVPAVQIYYAVSLDALVATSMLAALVAFVTVERRAPCVAFAAIAVFVASLLSFGFLFLLPVMLGYDLLVRRRPDRFVIVLLGVVALHALLRLSGFDYLTAFRTASAIENPRGFLLLADPTTYLVTRLEDLFEIALFFTPFLGALAARGVPALRAESPRLFTLTWLSLGVLVLMFLTGAYRTGETARACLFIVPILLLPVAALLKRRPLCDRDRAALLALPFGQAVLMQIGGNFFW